MEVLQYKSSLFTKKGYLTGQKVLCNKPYNFTKINKSLVIHVPYYFVNFPAKNLHICLVRKEIC